MTQTQPQRTLTTAPRCRIRHAGFQLVELIIAVAIVAVLASIAYPSYVEYRERANNAAAMTDIAIIAEAIERSYVQNQRFPANLAEVGMAGVLDPWG
ncbi:MAG: prepilin-type N-terminal cleavage/methylation domain-containing protein, partial [Thiogranum sp.]